MYFLVKIQNTQIFIIKALSRYICINTVKHSISKQGYFINKFIKQSQSKRDPIELILNNSSDERVKNKLSIHTHRRMTILNKVFMEYIIDMMSTGEIEPELLNRNIEITNVKITADFKFLNIHWIHHSEEQSDTENLLQKCAYKLRYELSQLRVIGNVPPIQFVKEKNIHKLAEVRQKLATLDFGEDFVPNTYPDAIYCTVNANTTSQNHEEARDTQRENISQDVFSVSIPVMKNDVFGLDHYKIMSKIKTSLSKVQTSHKIPVTNLHVDSASTPKLDIQNVLSFTTNEEQKKQFAMFLHQRRVQQKKRRNASSKTNNIIWDFKEQNYDVDDYEIENDCSGFTDEDCERLYECIDDECSMQK